eukprot:4076874-Pleurochrysis_carterae.AAC.3
MTKYGLDQANTVERDHMQYEPISWSLIYARAPRPQAALTDIASAPGQLALPACTRAAKCQAAYWWRSHYLISASSVT